MKIILYGNRNTGVVILSYLVAKGYEVSVITEDDNVKVVAEYYKLPIVTLDTMGEFDLFICCHGRKIIETKYLKEGKFINMHPCLFKYKGHNPIKRYLENKDTVGSIETHYIIEEIDGGEVICREEFETGEITTYAEFYNIALPYYLKVLDDTLVKFFEIYTNKIEGWMSDEELHFLYTEAKKMKDVVEIGSYLGRSTIALLKSKAKVTAIDTWKGNKELVVTKKDYKEFIRNTEKYSNLYIIVGESVKTSRQFKKVDMVFIDADHTYKGVKRDIKAWLPKTTKLICGHDYDIAEVKKAVDELMEINGVIGSLWYKNIK